MKKAIIVLLLVLTGCETTKPHYTPVDWNADTTPARPKHTVPDPPPQPPPSQQLPDNIRQLLDLHNKERTLKGRPELRIDEDLNDYADKHAQWMANNNNLKHSNINNVMKFPDTRTAGENIAWNQQNPQEVTKAWMNSSGHRANILNRDFTRVGFGLSLESNNSQPYWCTVFAGP